MSSELAMGPEPPKGLGPVGRPSAADERIERGIFSKLLVGVVGSLSPPAEVELAAKATPLLLSRRVPGSLRRA